MKLLKRMRLALCAALSILSAGVAEAQSVGGNIFNATGVSAGSVVAGSTAVSNCINSNGILYNGAGNVLQCSTLTTNTGGGLGIPNTGGIGFNGDTQITRIAAGILKYTNTSGAEVGFAIDASTDATAKFRNRTNTADADISANNVTANGNAIVGSQLQFVGTSKASSSVDGILTLTNSAGTAGASFKVTVDGQINFVNRTNTAGANLLAASVSATGTGGTGTFTAGSTGSIGWSARSAMASPADGNIVMQNAAGTSFGRLQFGGTTSSFPALKPNGAALQVRLADDTNYAALNTAGITANGDVLFGTDAAFDIGKNGATRPRNIFASGIINGQGSASFAAVQINATNAFNFATRTQLQSTADGNLLLMNSAGTGFGLLQFGGTTSSFPALATSGGALVVRAADNSQNSDIIVNRLFVGTGSPSGVPSFGIGMLKATDPGTAPGASTAKMFWVAGTTAGTCKLIAYAGTSTTPSTIVDNVGGGC